MASFKLLFFLGYFLATVFGERNNDIEVLVARIEQLELRDATQQRKIEELEATVKDQSKACDCEKKAGDVTNKDITNADDRWNHINRKARMAPENEVAFYATHTQHDILHLGANQALTFDNAVTNIGNALNNISGIFVAPVAGTYVFHATVMGRSVHVDTSSRFAAHFDVDGTAYSRFWVSPYDQSSQMLVIDLRPGQSVSIRNVHIDEGYIGNHQTTFSGFLLYEHDNNTGVIVGK
ncbi:hypothetical protein ACF0H5_001705 [Mactra antiquata]